MTVRWRSFWDLLPARVDRAFASPAIRSFRIRRRRARIERKARQARLSREGKPRLFIDLAVISKHDAGTGIQRVVRALALALVDAGAAGGWEVCFVSATRRLKYHRISWPYADRAWGHEAIEGQPGDVFLGLDYSLDTIRWHQAQLEKFCQSGGAVWFLVHDLLPLQRPEWFSQNTVLRYSIWMEIMAGLADGYICNSLQTETDLRESLSSRFGLSGGYRTRVVPMGGHILDAPAPSVGKGNAGNAVLRPRPASRFPYCLMVGSLEPRKGHRDIIAAFDVLWGAGFEGCLVLVGREGWQVDDLIDGIRNHQEYGRKLFWYDDVDDEELLLIYKRAIGVIIASYAEGFGLPLVEALSNNRPVLARDIEIFRCHEDHGVRYFPENADCEVLAEAIERWVGDVRSNMIKITVPESSWAISAEELLSAL